MRDILFFGISNPHLEVLIPELYKLAAGAGGVHRPDGRKGHAVEGIVLAGGVDGHIPEEETVALGEGGVEAIIADDIPGQAGRAAEPEGDGPFAGVARVQQGRAIGHLDDVRRVAGSGQIQDGKAGIAVAQGVQYRGDEIACVQRPGFAGFQIDLYAVLCLRLGDAALQRGQVVAGAGDVVSAAKVQPLHPGQQVAEAVFHGGQRQGQRVGILLTQGVEVQAVQQTRQGRVCLHSGVPLGTGGAQAAAGGAGVVDRMAFLGRAFRVDAQTDALARRFGCRAESGQLAGRVEDDVVGVVQQLVECVGSVGGAEHMVLLVGQRFPAEAALIEAAGLGARQIRCQQGVEVKVRERLLCQQDLAAGALLHLQQKFAVAAQLPFVQQVAGGGQRGKRFPRKVCKARKGRAGIGQPHQSTSAGLWLSERGRPYLSSASR